jgi:hypothetical protein
VTARGVRGVSARRVGGTAPTAILREAAP